MDDFCISALYRSGQTNPEKGIYYNSIFIRLQVMLQRYLIILGDLQLLPGLVCQLFLLAGQINPDFDPFQMEKSGNGHPVTAIITISAHHQYTVLVTQIFFHSLHCFQCSPFHKYHTRNPGRSYCVPVQLLHFTGCYHRFHSATSCHWKQYTPIFSKRKAMI